MAHFLAQIRSRRAVVAAAVALAALAACPGYALAQAKQTYSIVSFLDYSGPFANRGKPVEQMQRLLVDWFNKNRGATKGIELQYKPIDTGYDQAKTVQAYERAIQEPGVVGIVTFGSPN